MVDVGTDNMQLRADKVYMGLDQPRLKGDEYVEVCAYRHALVFVVGGCSFT